jgi:hypothetical protein
MNAAAVGISMCSIELPVDPELPVAPLPIIAAELPAIAPELAVDPERPIAVAELPAAGAPPEAKSTATTTMNNRAGPRRARVASPLPKRCVRRVRARQRSRIASPG